MFNSSFNVYKTEWLDLVFTNRNKSYGAYVLRSKSSSILLKSMLIASSIFILLFVSPLVYSKLFSKPSALTGIELPVPSDNTIFETKKPEVLTSPDIVIQDL